MNYTVYLSAAPNPELTLGGGAGGATETGTVAEAPGGGGFLSGDSLIPIFLLYAGIIAVFWFVFIRPQRKQQKQMREMQSSLKTGDNIITSSGTYGTIVEVGEEIFVVEFGSPKSVRIPVAKAHVVALKDPK